MELKQPLFKNNITRKFKTFSFYPHYIGTWPHQHFLKQENITLNIGRDARNFKYKFNLIM